MSIIQYISLDGFGNYFTGVLSVLLTRYHKSQTIAVRRGTWESLSLFILRFGGDTLFKYLEALQVGLSESLLTKFLIPECGTSWSGLMVSKAKLPKALVISGVASLMKTSLVKSKPELYMGLAYTLTQLAINDSTAETASLSQFTNAGDQEEDGGYSPQGTHLKNAPEPDKDWYKLPDVSDTVANVLNEVFASVPKIRADIQADVALYRSLKGLIGNKVSGF
ncbi:hypothetical protein GEMRC1_004386 [Eukaryota sp. GEM-RC1]